MVRVNQGGGKFTEGLNGARKKDQKPSGQVAKKKKKNSAMTEGNPK